MQKGIQTSRKPGISFITRCRNEQDYIEACITSLEELEVPYEVVVVLHRCSDNSKAIVERLRADGHPVRIFEYEAEVSRPGYEMLITPADHPSSLVSYYNFCASKARYNWIMKWDADFTAPPQLINYLDTLDMAETKPTNVRLGCHLGDSGVINRELYLSNALTGYYKYVFWEVPRHAEGVNEVQPQLPYIQSISYQVLKDYWREPAWFDDSTTGDPDLAERHRAAVAILGTEPIGMARASNPECDDIFRKVFAQQADLAKAGIDPFA